MEPAFALAACVVLAWLVASEVWMARRHRRAADIRMVRLEGMVWNLLDARRELAARLEIAELEVERVSKMSAFDHMSLNKARLQIDRLEAARPHPAPIINEGPPT